MRNGSVRATSVSGVMEAIEMGDIGVDVSVGMDRRNPGNKSNDASTCVDSCQVPSQFDATKSNAG